MNTLEALPWQAEVLSETRAPALIPQEERLLYYRKLYRLLAMPNATPDEKLAAQSRLAEMSFGDKTDMVYNPKGQYGASQISPLRKYMGGHPDKAPIKDIINRYYPAADEEMQLKILRRLNKAGCGFVAVINGIFFAYAANPLKFEKEFGIKMYKAFGTSIFYNFDLLLVDFFTYAHKSISPVAFTLGRGTMETVRRLFWDGYLASRGMAKTIELGAFWGRAGYSEINNIWRQGGTAILSIRPCTFYSQDINGEEKQHGSFKGKKTGHAIVVTGIKSNGDFVISSWGRQYYIKAQEVKKYRWMHLQKMLSV